MTKRKSGGQRSRRRSGQPIAPQPDARPAGPPGPQHVAAAQVFRFPRTDETGSVVVDAYPANLGTSVVALAVRSLETGEVEGRGSAFCVAALPNGEAVYVTAKHVVEDISTTENLEALIFVPRGTTDPVAAQQTAALTVEEVNFASGHSDVAVLRVNVKSASAPIEGVLHRLPIAIRRAKEGERTFALGWPVQKIDATMIYKLLLRGSQGFVEEVHDSRRDNSMSTFPSFQVNGRYESGMSGGPVIGEDGAVIGVVSTGMSFDDGPPQIGWAASIAPITELVLQLPADQYNPLGMISKKGKATAPFPVNFMITTGAIDARGPGAIVARSNEFQHLIWPGSPNFPGVENTAAGPDTRRRLPPT